MGFLVRAKPRVESDERSFLKGLVSKRLEEMESGAPPIDPLELLGLTGSAPSPVPNTTPSTSSSKEEPPTATRVADATTTAPSRPNDGNPTSASPIQSVIAESLSDNTDSVVSGSFSTDCVPGTLQTEHSPQDTLQNQSPSPVADPYPPTSHQSVVAGGGDSASSASSDSSNMGYGCLGAPQLPRYHGADQDTSGVLSRIGENNR